MRLVDDQGVVGFELRIGLRFSKQYPIGHQLNACTACETFLKANLVTNMSPKRAAKFFGDPSRHCRGGQAARLGMANQATIASPGKCANLGQLCCFS